MGKRQKHPLGDLFGLRNFGVNLTRLLPGGESALLHRHSRQDEFVYILEGRPTLVTDRGEVELEPGMCAGFAAAGVAHHLVNRTGADAVYLEIGDRTPGDAGSYPDDDLAAVLGPEAGSSPIATARGRLPRPLRRSRALGFARPGPYLSASGASAPERKPCRCRNPMRRVIARKAEIVRRLRAAVAARTR